MFIKPSIFQNTRFLLLSKTNDVKYQCNIPDCLPSTVVFAGNLRNCELICLANTQCRTITFDQSTNQCEVFSDIPSANGYLLAQTGVVTLTVVDNRQLSARE